jgi:hypothetical protein
MPEYAIRGDELQALLLRERGYAEDRASSGRPPR